MRSRGPDVRRRIAAAVSVGLACAVTAACGGSPSGPSPGPGPGPNPTPNTAPVIETIAVSATRTEVETDVTFTATVRDAETAIDQLKFEWKADAGTFSGAGPSVTWRVPKGVATPADYTVTLTVTETYGTANAQGVRPQHTVTRSAPVVRVHDSPKEVGAMSRQFLIDFSTTTIKDWQVVMRNFKAAACPQPGEIEAEKEDVIHHYTFFNMQNYEIGPAAVSVRFVGSCPYAGKLGDACAAVPVYWDSIDTRNNSRGPTRGVEHISAAYSVADSRWWLCSSYFEPTTTLTGHSSYWR